MLKRAARCLCSQGGGAVKRPTHGRMDTFTCICLLLSLQPICTGYHSMREGQDFIDGQEELASLELPSTADEAVAADAMAPAAAAAAASGGAPASLGGLALQPLQQYAPPPLLCSRTAMGRRVLWTQELHAAFLAAIEAAGASSTSQQAAMCPASSSPRLRSWHLGTALPAPTKTTQTHTPCPVSAGGVQSAKAKDILARMGVEGLTLQ